ncbi:hypothetical protein ACFVIY_27315 [Streptomyces sp. NPDC127166]|uniref:hypothetical protein n=1 Tax=Streptomyces sp. NPDC127166 TaxID=3345380 RepID=UPI00362DA4E7
MKRCWSRIDLDQLRSIATVTQTELSPAVEAATAAVVPARAGVLRPSISRST